ncbi:integral membrane protein [Apiospora kogelbergensis]|uniref:Integral membrane protein n=1 Tax=Apiospora kogelbergensis TaxID=1337665 RepID=A0AAW0Q8N1_9PEZI
MWDLPLAGVSPESTARCMDLGIYNYVCSGSNIIMDLVIFAIPVPLIHRLQISSRQKRALLMVFCFGGFVIIASVIRLIALEQYITAAEPSGPVVQVALWSGVEINISIICACLATLRPLLSNLFPGLLPSAGSASSATTKSPGGSLKKGRKNQQQTQAFGQAKEMKDGAGDGNDDGGEQKQVLMRLLQQQLVRQATYAQARRFPGRNGLLGGKQAGEWGQKYYHYHASQYTQNSEHDTRRKDVHDIV